MNKYISTFEIGESEYKLKDSEVRTDLGAHEENTDIHVTAAEKEYWNSKVNPPSYSAPTAKTLTYTGEAQDLLNPGSSTSGSIQYSTDEVSWSTTIPQATNAGTYTVYWKFAGSEIVYVDSTAISVTIAKANPTYTAPTAKSGLVYNTSVQELLNAGTSSDGTISYSDDNENWGSSIPQGTNAGSHMVYWKLTGDANHNDVATTSISVSIAKADKDISVTPITTAASGSTASPTVSGDDAYSFPESGVYAAYADGSMRTAENADTNAIGVAVITDNCKFVIDKTNETNFTAWDSQDSTNGVIAGCFATDDSSTAKTNYTGVSNTNAIAAVASGGEAAKYCRGCSKTIAGKTVYGYLGACGEWQVAYDNKATIDSIVSIIEGTAIFSTYYWTSTLYLSDSRGAWDLYWPEGSVTFSAKRGGTNHIRPFYEIDGTPSFTITSSNASVAIVSGTTINAVGKGTTTITVTVAGDSNYNEYIYSYTLTVTGPMHNGHEYVDLGLPSGTKWATMNVGANSEEGYGNYYMYGKGANDSSVTSGASAYTGTEDPLSLSVDTAAQVLGGSWHMPTQTQFEELMANTTYSWETNFNDSGIRGGKFTASNGEYIFFPAAGKLTPSGSLAGSASGTCIYRSSTPITSSTATCLYLNGTIYRMTGNRQNDSRTDHNSVRGVVG